MPQFDFSTFPTQVFWLFVCFAALYFLLSKLVMPRIDDILTERQERVDTDLEKAASLKAETEEAIATYEKALAEARSQAQEVLKKAQDDISKQNEAKNKDVADKLAAQIKDGEAKIAKAKTEALDQVRDIATDVAKSATEKLAGVKATDTALKAAVGAAVKEQG